MMNMKDSERERIEERETKKRWGFKKKREDNGKEATEYTTWLIQ